MDIFATATKVEPDDKLARIIGVNMEGPLIDIAKKGAQAAEYISVPDVSFSVSATRLPETRSDW